MTWPLTVAATLAGGVFLQAGSTRNAASAPETKRMERTDITVVIVLERDSAVGTSGYGIRRGATPPRSRERLRGHGKASRPRRTRTRQASNSRTFSRPAGSLNGT